MNAKTTLIAGVLVAAVITLAVTVTVAVVATGDDNSRNAAMADSMMANDTGSAGMMGAMGSMASDDMLKHMREVLGEEGYQRMLAHLADHRNGTPMTGNAATDQMMHTMMDGMMQSMPAGGGSVLPPGNDQHHELPVPATTPTPTP